MVLLNGDDQVDLLVFLQTCSALLQIQIAA